MRMSDEAKQAHKDRFLAAMQETLSVTHAAHAAGISRRTAYSWRDEDPDFAEAWAEAREAAIDDLEASAFERAKDGDTTLTIFLLKCHRPAIYGHGAKGRTAATSTPPAAVKPPTLADIFRGGSFDLATLESWQKIVEALDSYDVQEIAPMLI